MTELWVYGRDLVVGDRFELAAYDVNEADIVEFARRWDPLALHTDADAAEQGRFGGIIASGVQTLGVFQRLAVLGHWRLWRIVAGRGVSDLRFLRPVRPGDTLSGWFEVSAVDPSARTDEVVTISGTLNNQLGETVLTLVMKLQIERAPR